MGVSETLPHATFAATGITCASGYSGTATASVCGTGGAAYTVSGCTRDCTQPTDSKYNFASVSETLPHATFAATGITCASGNSGTVTVTKCTGGNDYTVEGCKGDCTRPTDSKYNFASVSETLPHATFAATGITCASGYSGTVTVTKCTGGNDYTVEGC